MEISSFIDHTLLRPDTTVDGIKALCAEAMEYQFASVCVPPYYIPHAVRVLEESKVKVGTVVGFPIGYSNIAAKVEEIKRAINDSVDELDIVINFAAAKNGDWAYVRNEMDSVIRASHLHGKLVKIILEVGLYNEEELKRLCDLAAKLECDFVKTSTGFYDHPVTVDQVAFLRAHLPKTIKIKASGGIRQHQLAVDLLNAGAARLGTSASVAIMKEAAAANT